MRSYGVRRLGLVLVFGLAWAQPAFAELTDERIEQARGEVLGSEYQSALPGVDKTASVPSAGGGQRINADGTIDTRELHVGYHLGLFGEILQMVMYVGLLIGLVMLLFFLVAEFAAVNHDVKLPKEGPQAPEGPDMAVIERPLADAEELARRGEYREAIHTLLLRTLRELVRSTAVRVPPSLTSREILAHVPLHDSPRAALADLISAVEITHFGGDDASVADYERCLAQFRIFATSFQRSAARA